MDKFAVRRYQNLTIADAAELCYGHCSYPKTVAAGRSATLTAVRLLREAQKGGRLKIHPRELSWLDRIKKNVETIPQDESEFIGEMMGKVGTTKFVPADYDL